jgi:NAD(P)-dependent dehydrogenase (short-subunit alcohol dehydrogenase family)
MSTELLDGRICLVTGSSRGIGLGVARALAAHGGTVILHGREEETLRSALASLKGPGRHITSLRISRTMTE